MRDTADYHVYVWSDESRVHYAVIHDGAMLSSERCNLDDVKGDRTISPDMPEDFDHGRFCQRCFPEMRDE